MNGDFEINSDTINYIIKLSNLGVGLVKKSAVLIGGIIGVVAIVMFAGGFFSYSMIEQHNENSLSQSLAIGGYGIVKAYHTDGTLFYEWEGHNALTPIGINALVGCITGLATTPSGFRCDTGMTIKMFLNGPANFHESTQTIQTLVPAGCDIISPNYCNGWNTRGTFDFSSLVCTPGVDCPSFDKVKAGANNPFNELNVTPQEVTPGDIVVVTITFNPS